MQSKEQLLHTARGGERGCCGAGKYGLHEPRESGIHWFYKRVQQTSTESWLPACMCFSDSNFSIEIMEHMIGEGDLIQMSFYSFLNVNMS